MEGFSGGKAAGMDRIEPYSTDNTRVYPGSDYTMEDYYKDFELDHLGFDKVPDKPGTSLMDKEKEGNDIKDGNDVKDGNADRPAG